LRVIFLLLFLAGLVVALPLSLPLQAGFERCEQPRRLQPLPASDALESLLPQPLALPLPESLAGLPTGVNYLDQVLPSRYGYLRWPALPICLYIQPAEEGTTAAAQRTRLWVEAVAAAAETWSRYLALQQVSTPDRADILVQRRSPPLRRTPDGQLAPARTAEVVFHLFLEPVGNAQQMIQPQFNIDLGLHQGTSSLQQTALHELGHALGIWGHSPDPQDVMVDRQTRQTILLPSASDIATLRQLYEQPSMIGVPLRPVQPKAN
jgi:predicted Zn-dependent protease